MHWTDKVKRIVAERGISYRQVEKSASWTPNTLKTAIQKRSSVSVDRAIRLSSALNASVIWLFDGSEEWKEPPTFSGNAEWLSFAQSMTSLMRGCVCVGTQSPMASDRLIVILYELSEQLRSVSVFTPERRKILVDGLWEAIELLQSAKENFHGVNIRRHLKGLETGEVNTEPEDLLIDPTPPPA